MQATHIFFSGSSYTSAGGIIIRYYTQQELACLLLCRKDVFIWAATSAHIEDDDEHDYYHLGIKRATHTE